ncbi:response regulator transcription factor [Limnochorda pilosa]|uniref:Transcriptional regulator n=1 Tax=Limnochorda pilosa TaxID=1555112 RepID=A0A0K2SQY7_LIMPI|nr:response regulator transcription factor [Limnochorda pilosa]BAS29219.1 transcriptional regulator [Limnochorda pilosa]
MGQRILVVDDDPRLQAMLRRVLVLEGFEVLQAFDGPAALRMLQDEPVDLVVLDWMLPGVDGLEVCRRVRELGQAPILMLTAKDAVEDRVRGLTAGADDYLVKPFATEELVARMRALLRRSQAPAEQLRFGDLVLDVATREARRGQRSIELTTTEYELLHLFMRHPRQVLPRERILEEVWGYDFRGESNVLEVYVGYLRRKLEEGGEPRLIHTVRGAGYVLRE